MPFAPIACGDSVTIEPDVEDQAREMIRELTGDGWHAQRRVRLDRNAILPAAVVVALSLAVGILVSSVVGARLGETEREAYVCSITIFPLVFLGFHGLAAFIRRTPSLSILRDGLVIHQRARNELIAWADLVSIATEQSELRITSKRRTVRIRAYRLDDAKVKRCSE